nr:hemagglutinin repeat-containing protein [Serratia rhizosphaerae]
MSSSCSALVMPDAVSQSLPMISWPFSRTQSAPKSCRCWGAQVSAEVGRNLTLQSQQDSDRYDAKQTSVSGGVSVPIGAGSGSANLSASRDKLHSNYCKHTGFSSRHFLRFPVFQPSTGTLLASGCSGIHEAARCYIQPASTP